MATNLVITLADDADVADIQRRITEIVGPGAAVSTAEASKDEAGARAPLIDQQAPGTPEGVTAAPSSGPSPESMVGAQNRAEAERRAARLERTAAAEAEATEPESKGSSRRSRSEDEGVAAAEAAGTMAASSEGVVSAAEKAEAEGSVDTKAVSRKSSSKGPTPAKAASRR